MSSGRAASAQRWLLWLLAGAVILAQLLLMWGVFLPVPHTGGDNAGYVALAHALLEGEGYVEIWDPAAPLHTKYPPVFPAILAAAVALGARSWTALKLVPAAFATLSVLLAWLWASGRRGPLFGAGVALLLSASSVLLWYSHWILSDVPFLAFTLLALWAADRAEGREGEGSAEVAEVPEEDRLSAPWVAAAMAGAILAYFTRSAGLPLLVALAGWLALRRGWKLLGVLGVVAGVPALLWFLRGARAAGEAGAAYVGEFWMVDPYRPEAGTVNAGGLVERMAANLSGYVGTFIPEGLAPFPGGWSGFVGLLLVGGAVAGWGMTVARRGGRAGLAELFFPLYAGLILLWPEVWSGDRFALPLFPLLLLYAGDAALRGVRRAGQRGAVRTGVGAALLLALLVPALQGWRETSREARTCSAAARGVGGGPWACSSPAWRDFVEAAAWAGANLPEGSAVLSRKPRFFHLLGGVPSRTYPFTRDPSVFLEEARRAGADYVLLDFLDRQGITYVGGVVQARPEIFCSVVGVGGEESGYGAQLLGIVPGDSGLGGRVVEGPDGPALSMPACPEPLRPRERVEPPIRNDFRIPLLSSGG